MPSLMPFDRRVDVGDEEIVADELHFGADLLRDQFPARPIVFRHAVFDRDDRIFGGELGEIIGLLLRRAGLALAFVNVRAVLEEFAGRRIEREKDIAARLVAGLADRLHDEIERGFRRRQVGRKAAFVADVGIVAGRFERAAAACGRFPSRSAALREKLGAPAGMIMNSWKSIGLSACTPPLMMFIIGTGSTRAAAPPT